MDPTFYFEEWEFLAKRDPHAFELRRKAAVDRFLEESSSRQRRLGIVLQREIDAERRRAPDPQVALLVIARMLCEQLIFLGEEMNGLRDDIRELPCAKAA
jgi:hypothetical protein